MNAPSMITKRQFLLTFFLLTLISVTSVECMFANGFIIPYTIASRFFQQRNNQESKSPVSSSSSGDKNLGSLTDSFNQNENDAKAILPPLFPLNFPGKSVASSQSVNPSASFSSSNSNSNSDLRGKPILKLRIGSSLSSPQGKSSLSSSSSSKEKYKYIPIDMSVLKSPPAKSFSPKTSFKPITQATNSRILANPLSLPSLDPSLIDDDFSSSDNKQPGPNSHYIHSPSSRVPASSSSQLSPSSSSSSSAEVREFQRAQLENTLNNDFSPRAKSQGALFKHPRERPASASFSSSSPSSQNFPLTLGRQMNANQAVNDGPVADDAGESYFGNFGSKEPSDGEGKNPLLQPSSVTKDLRNSMKENLESESDRRNMIKYMARVVDEGGSVRDALVKQLNEKTGLKLSPENVALTNSANRPGGRYSPVHEFVNYFYGPIGSESEGDALTDFLMSDANAISSPGKRVKSIIFHSANNGQAESESIESKPLATEGPNSS